MRSSWTIRLTAPLLMATLAACSDPLDPAATAGGPPQSVLALSSAALVWHIETGAGTAGQVSFGVAGDVPVPADYDGDGKADIATFRPSTNTWWVLRSMDGATTTVAFGANGDIPVPADYDGDGKADYAVFRPSTGQWWVLGSMAGGSSVSFGAPGDTPMTGDYNGDGFADYSVYRPATGEWYTLYGYLATWDVASLPAGQTPVHADFDGDGRADRATFADGVWSVVYATGGTATAYFGTVGDIPVPEDYDGDGRTDLAILRPATAEWWTLRSSDGGTSAVAFGLPGDLPVPADYLATAAAERAVVREQVIYPFQFTGPVKAGALNSAGAGGIVPVMFSLSGYVGPDVFAAGYPQSQQVSCTAPYTPTGASASTTAGASEFTFVPDGSFYRYMWRTERAWAGTCRMLTLMLTDGSVHTIVYRFN